MSLLTARLKLTGHLGDRAFYDTARGHILTIPTGAAVRLQVGIFKPDGTTVDSTTGLTTLSLEIYESRLDAALYLPAVATSSFSSLTAETWADGTAQHATLSLTSEQTNKILTTGLKQCWAVISATDGDGERIDLAAGPVLLFRTNAGGTGPEGEIDPLYPTLVQLVALLAAKADLVPAEQLPPVEAAVTSVAGRTGAIVLGTSDITGLDTTLTGKAPTSTTVTLTGAQTLTNKTLTAPVMTTPALGTPASGDLGNCTNVPAGQLAGNVAVARIATALTAPGPIGSVTPGTVAGTTGTFSTSLTVTAPDDATATLRLQNGYGLGRFTASGSLAVGVVLGSPSSVGFYFQTATLTTLGSTMCLGWVFGGGWSGGSDVAFARNATNAIEINRGVRVGAGGSYGSLVLQSLTSVGGLITVGTFTVGTLPVASTNLFGSAAVTNALAPAVGAIVATGGSARAVVRSNGTNWIVTEVL